MQRVTSSDAMRSVDDAPGGYAAKTEYDLRAVFVQCFRASNKSQQGSNAMKFIANLLIKLGILKQDLDYHFIRASMVVIFLFFGYQKWFDYEAQALIPYINHGPLIFWMYSVFGLKGATWFLGVAEWFFAALLFAGFWKKKVGLRGALVFFFFSLATITFIPFTPNGWPPPAGGSPAMTETVAFLLKDLVLLAVSVYLLRQDVLRVSRSGKQSPQTVMAEFQQT